MRGYANYQTFLNDFTLTHNELYTDLPHSRRVKRKWIKKGYDEQISFYGVIKNAETKDTEYRRIEILLNVTMTQEIFERLYNYFQDMIPPKPYTIWIYDLMKDSVAQVGRFD